MLYRSRDGFPSVQPSLVRYTIYMCLFFVLEGDYSVEYLCLSFKFFA